jgi:hypothetical protein
MKPLGAAKFQIRIKKAKRITLEATAPSFDLSHFTAVVMVKA